MSIKSRILMSVAAFALAGLFEVATADFSDDEPEHAIDDSVAAEDPLDDLLEDE